MEGHKNGWIKGTSEVAACFFVNWTCFFDGDYYKEFITSISTY